MFTNKAKLDRLQEIKLFAGLSKKDLQLISKGSEELTVPAGTVVVDQGQTGREALVLMSGTVTVKRNERKIATREAGTVIGELSLLDHGPRSATVVCDTECTFLLIDQPHFRKMLESSPKLSMRLLATLASRIRELDTKYQG
jgi:CRP-like cAMP-binding protein